MFPPELSWSFLGVLGPAIVETIQISVMGVVVACLVAIPLGLLATSTLTWSGILHEQRPARHRWLLGFMPYALSRALLSIFRSIPEFVWAFMFVRAVGLGPFPGVLAIGVAYGGMLGKVYSEILEGVNSQPLEALHASGAGKLGIVLYGLLPQALPNVISYTLYRWECAIRASAILGFVGAGGLGQQVELSMRMFQFNEVITILAVLFLLVASVDLISGKIRAWVVR
jgi:phosphonate transport system permease protein